MKQSLPVSYSAGKLSSESCACLAWASSCAWVTTAGNLQITSDCYSKVLHEISIQVSTKSAHDTVATTSPLYYGYPASNPESFLSIAPSAAGELPALAPRHVQPHGSSLHPWSMEDLSLRSYLMLPLYGINMWEKDGKGHWKGHWSHIDHIEVTPP